MFWRFIENEKKIRNCLEDLNNFIKVTEIEFF